jgi:serine/threonine protein kinase
MHPGTRIGPYEVTISIGAGGMGEVFRARDTRLNRDVAIKVLPKDFVADADRLRRFEQEAKMLAALNHPNVLTIHDAGVHEGAPYLVSELLEGRTLREEMNRGALPVRKATEYALHIGHGLAAAHGRGVIHRDLKPENVFITKDGRVKILDFGLGKLRANPKSEIPNSTSAVAATIRIDADAMINTTEPGVVLGTPAYMSPEQVRGEPADHRADIFAFGAVLYEMVTGTRAFRRETPIASMNAVLNEELPELSKNNADIPPALERILRHCLEKRPNNRFQSAQDLAFAIENSSDASREKSRATLGQNQRTGKWLLATASVALLGLLIGFVLPRFRSGAPTGTSAGVRYLTHSGRDFSPSASPDGKRVCFTSDRDGTNRIWMKDLVSASESPLTSGSDDSPRFSPDGSSILFTRLIGFERSLYRISSIGGEPSKIVDDVFTGDWSPDGRHVAFVRWENRSADGSISANSSLHLIGVDGSGETLLARFEGNRYSFPRWSPGGKKIAVSMHPSQAAPAIAVVTIATKTIESIKLPGLNVVSSAVWAPDSRGLIYMQPESAGADSSSVSARIYRQTEAGEAQQLGWSPAFGRTIELLPPNKLIFGVRSPRENLREIFVGASSNVSARALTAGISTDRQPCYSPDGDRVIFTSNQSGNLDIWSLHRKAGAIRRLTENPADDWDPAFSPDGKHLLFSSSRTGQFEIWMANVDGTNPRQVTRGGFDCENPAMTPDGKWIVYLVADPQKNGIWKIRPDGTEATRLSKEAGYGIPEISPDGQYLAYFRDASADLRVLRVLSLEAGKVVPFEIKLLIQKETIASLGRLRWMPGGKAIAFVGPDERGVHGVYVQDFVPGRDTLATRRPLGGFDREHPAESFGISTDGQWLTIAAWEQLFSIMVTDALPSF